MTYIDMPVIIPLLATGYLLGIYLLLILAQRTIKNSQYATNSLTDAYAAYVQPERVPLTDEVERWSRSSFGTVSSELPSMASQPQKIQEVSSIH